MVNVACGGLLSGFFFCCLIVMSNGLTTNFSFLLLSFLSDDSFRILRFRIHKPKEFTRDIMPKYFQMSSFSSFQRQLNLYDFQRITEGPERDAYYHEMFVRGNPVLCTRIRRNKVKGLTRAKQEERFMSYEKGKSSVPVAEPNLSISNSNGNGGGRKKKRRDGGSDEDRKKSP